MGLTRGRSSYGLGILLLCLVGLVVAAVASTAGSASKYRTVHDPRAVRAQANVVRCQGGGRGRACWAALPTSAGYVTVQVNAAHHEGDRVTLRYNPADPRHAEEGMSAFGDYVLPTALDLCVLGLLTLVLRGLRRRARGSGAVLD